MYSKAVIVLDIVALLMTAIWMIRGIIIGLSAADLIYNYLYPIVIFTALLLTLLDKFLENF